MEWTNYDIVVIGGGLAGSLTVDRLYASGSRVAWFDRDSGTSATSTGAGIMNPITGRKFVYSWMFDRFYKQAVETYQALESSDHQILHPLSILKGLATPGDENNWCLRLGEPLYSLYIKDTLSAQSLPFLREIHRIGVIEPVYRVDMSQVVKRVISHWGKPVTAELIAPRTLLMDNVMASIPEKLPVILATGSPVKKIHQLNLPLQPYQGQALLIRSSDLPTDKIIHHKLKVVPYGNDHFWIGSFDQWDDLTEHPTARGRLELLKALDRYFDIQYEVVGQLSGIRPSSRTRRPFVGELPGHPKTYVINGLGTKGASLAPLMVKTLCDFLLFAVDIPDDFSIPAG